MYLSFNIFCTLCSLVLRILYICYFTYIQKWILWYYKIHIFIHFTTPVNYSSRLFVLAICPCSYLPLWSNKQQIDMQPWSVPYLEWVQPGVGCPHLRPCRPATSWGHPGWWRGGYLPSGRTGPAPDTARRDHQRGRSQSKLVRASEDRVYKIKVSVARMQTCVLTHAHTHIIRDLPQSVCEAQV